MQAEKNKALMAVLVVYERGLADVVPWRRLWGWLECDRDNRSGFNLDHLLIYDNSSRPRAEPPVGIRRCEYGTIRATAAPLPLMKQRSILPLQGAFSGCCCSTMIRSCRQISWNRMGSIVP